MKDLIVFCFLIGAFHLTAAGEPGTGVCSATRPCGSSCDISTKCIQSLFDPGTSGEPVTDADENEPVLRERYVCNTPILNSTIISKSAKITIKGPILDAKVYEAEKKVLLVLGVQGTVIDTKATYIINRRGLLPYKITGQTKITLPVEVTCWIGTKNGKITKETLQNDLNAYGHLTSTDIPLVLGSNILNSKEPVVITLIKQLGIHKRTVALELYKTTARNLCLIYVQKYIYDYGLSISNFD